MRCPMCLGKGYATDEDIKEYPNRCPNCNGKGFYSVDWQTVRCEVCNGSGKKPQTNEEWLRSCNTEQLAEEIYECVMTHPWHISKEVILEWLKQPHKPIS